MTGTVLRYPVRDGAPEDAPTAEPATRGPWPGRLIVVGVRDAAADAATLRWVATEAVPGHDVVHLVHAYVPVRLEDCSWEPVVRRRTADRLHATRTVSMAMQQVRGLCPDLRVEASAVAGLPSDVLGEFARIVDLVVVGSGSRHRSATSVGQWVDAACPVIRVPSGWTWPPATAPVIVVGRDEGDVPPSALAFGAEWALRHERALHVCVPASTRYGEEPPTAAWLAGQQERLDRSLEPLVAGRPGLGLVGRVEWAAGWRRRLATEACLLVHGDGHHTPVRGGCAVAEVPS